jgi:hypothetical protein
VRSPVRIWPPRQKIEASRRNQKRQRRTRSGRFHAVTKLGDGVDEITVGGMQVTAGWCRSWNGRRVPGRLPRSHPIGRARCRSHGGRCGSTILPTLHDAPEGIYGRLNRFLDEDPPGPLKPDAQDTRVETGPPLVRGSPACRGSTSSATRPEIAPVAMRMFASGNSSHQATETKDPPVSPSGRKRYSSEVTDLGPRARHWRYPDPPGMRLLSSPLAPLRARQASFTTRL